MITNLIIFIGGLLILLLSLVLIKNNLKPSKNFRVISNIIILPATLSALYLTYITFAHQTVIVTKNIYYIFNSDLGFHITPINSALILCSVLSVQIFIFLAPANIINNNFLFLLTTTILCFFMQIFNNLFLVSIIFIFINIFLTFLRIYKNDNLAIKDLTRDFLWQRLADILAIIGLLLFYSINNNILTTEISSAKYNNLYYFNNLSANYASILLFLSVIIRILSIKPNRMDHDINYSLLYLSNLQYRCSIGISCTVWLNKIYDLIFIDNNIIYYQISISIIVIFSLINYLVNHRKNNSDIYFVFLLLNINLLIISLNLSNYYHIISGWLILVFTWHIINSEKAFLFQNKCRENYILERYNRLDLLLSINFIGRKIIIFISRVSSNFINPFYSGFLLYKLPQLLVSAIQIPIRFFHNGSIQRSMLFIVIMAASYYSIWG